MADGDAAGAVETSGFTLAALVRAPVVADD